VPVDEACLAVVTTYFGSYTKHEVAEIRALEMEEENGKQ
jgi:hypothetical protein